MSELTPERIRDAAEVLARYVAVTDPIEHKNTHRVAVSANMLLTYAEELEREQVAREEAAAAQVMELAEWLQAYYRSCGTAWLCVAAKLIDRYPALAEQIREGRP